MGMDVFDYFPKDIVDQNPYFKCFEPYGLHLQINYAFSKYFPGVIGEAVKMYKEGLYYPKRIIVRAYNEKYEEIAEAIIELSLNIKLIWGK